MRIPVNTNAVVLVSDVPPRRPGAERGGLKVIALFPQANGQSKDTGSGEDVRVGDMLRVALPGEKQPHADEAGVGQPARAARRARSSTTTGCRSARPTASSRPATSRSRRCEAPPGKRPRSYEGTTTTEASVQTGSRRIISLLF